MAVSSQPVTLQEQSLAPASFSEGQPAAPIAQARPPTPTQSSQSTIASTEGREASPAEEEGATASGGCCTTLCDLIAKVIAALCDFLSGLPVIGSWFATAPEMTASEVFAMQSRINAIEFITRDEETRDEETRNDLFARALLCIESNVMHMLQDASLTPQPGASLGQINNQLEQATRGNPALQQRYMREVSLPFWTQVLELYTAQKGLETADVNAYCDIITATHSNDRFVASHELGDHLIERMHQEVCEHLRDTILRELYGLLVSNTVRALIGPDLEEEFVRSNPTIPAYELVKRRWDSLPENIPIRTRFYQKILLPISQEVRARIPTWVLIKEMEDKIFKIKDFILILPQLQPDNADALNADALLEQSETSALLFVLDAIRAMANRVGVAQRQGEEEAAFAHRVHLESEKTSAHLEMYLRTVELPLWQCVQRLMNEAPPGPESGSSSSAVIIGI